MLDSGGHKKHKDAKDDADFDIEFDRGHDNAGEAEMYTESWNGGNRGRGGGRRGISMSSGDPDAWDSASDGSEEREPTGDELASQKSAEEKDGLSEVEDWEAYDFDDEENVPCSSSSSSSSSSTSSSLSPAHPLSLSPSTPTAAGDEEDNLASWILSVLPADSSKMNAQVAASSVLVSLLESQTFSDFESDLIALLGDIPKCRALSVRIWDRRPDSQGAHDTSNAAIPLETHRSSGPSPQLSDANLPFLSDQLHPLDALEEAFIHWRLEDEDVYTYMADIVEEMRACDSKPAREDMLESLGCMIEAHVDNRQSVNAFLEYLRNTCERK